MAETKIDSDGDDWWFKEHYTTTSVPIFFRAESEGLGGQTLILTSAHFLQHIENSQMLRKVQYLI